MDSAKADVDLESGLYHKNLDDANGGDDVHREAAVDVESGRNGNSNSGPGGGGGGGGGRSPESGASGASKSRPVRVLFRKAAVMLAVTATVAVVAAAIWYYMGWMSVLQLVLVAIVAYLAAGGKYRWFIVAIKTAPRDLTALLRYIGLLLQIRSYERKDLTVADVFRQNVAKHPNKICFVHENQEWTFTQVEEYSNKIANVFKSHGYKKGDVVALFMENRPEFVCTWLGLSKLGVIIPLINTNQKQSSLVHSITIAKSQAVIFSDELSGALVEVLDKIESTVALYKLGDQTGDEGGKIQNINRLLKDAANTPPNLNEKVGYHDRLVYIYTSGTTGLPKAAVISNSRFFFIVGGIHRLAGFKSSDKFYNPLPLYHTAGGCMSVGQALVFGATVVLRKKFSASAFFPDIRKYECTVAHYIGEMCRYILAVKPTPEDKQHKLRVIYGNGLRPQIWSEFVERFNIPKVAEFYGATEGNANIVNITNTVGAIGFVSRIIPSVYPISIIRADPATGEPIRNAKGLCVTCGPDEPGVFIGKIIPNNHTRAFLGYVDKKASEKKIVRDVFQKGDSAFLSGDILISDEYGNLYFKDRTGDTFRWKGENVSTSEVEAVISNLVSYKDVVAYGVEIRGQEGRAGMAAILDPENMLDLEKLAKGVKGALPPYARPQFVRILQKLDMTGTYKLKKTDLQKEGFDPEIINDNIYYLNSSGEYDLVTKDVYDKINSGIIRL